MNLTDMSNALRAVNRKHFLHLLAPIFLGGIAVACYTAFENEAESLLYKVVIIAVILILLLSLERALISRCLKTYLQNLPPELRELIGYCSGSPTRTVNVSVYDPRVFELKQLNMVTIGEYDIKDGSQLPSYQIRMEDWVYDFLRGRVAKILRIG